MIYDFAFYFAYMRDTHSNPARPVASQLTAHQALLTSVRVAMDIWIRVIATLSTGAVVHVSVARPAERRRLRLRIPQRRISRRQRRSRNQRRALRRHGIVSRRTRPASTTRYMSSRPLSPRPTARSFSKTFTSYP